MIKIYNDFLTSEHAVVINSFVLKSLYQIGWYDTEDPEHARYPNLHSVYGIEELNKIKILDPILRKVKHKKITLKRCIVNLTKPLDINFIHVHPKQTVALYYVNLNWNPEWGGETIFYNDDKKKTKLTNLYTPNQLVIFDGSIPHTIKSQNLMGPTYRFTLSLFFDN
jgi:Rps23 Pro-64 3,4-dihydroxylase Tpa1-like proline 4-hydroxylase